MTGPSDRHDGGAFRSLRQMARGAAANVEERCDLCGEGVPVEHRHMLNVSTRELLCACRACAILFHRSEAGAGERRLVPTRYLSLDGFQIADEQWEGLAVPVNIVFFTHNTGAGRVLALYPSPAGPTESLLPLETWDDLVAHNPVLTAMEPDVEALLVNRTRGKRQYFLVPIDECYRLVGIIRAYWRGLSGGRDVWGEIDRFFDGLAQRAAPRGGRHA